MRHITQYPCQRGVDNAKLAGKLNHAVLTDNVDLDFSRIFQLFLYALRDSARKRVHGDIRDLAWVHKDAYLSPRCNSVHLLYAGEGTREALKVAETLQVAVYRVSSCARASPRYRVCDLHDNRLWRLIRIFFIVRLHRLYNALVYTEFLQNASPYLNMGALHLVVNRLPDVVQERSHTRDSDISTKLCREHSGDMRHLNRVLKHILPITGTKVETPKECRELRVKPDDADFICGRFSFLFD